MSASSKIKLLRKLIAKSSKSLSHRLPLIARGTKIASSWRITIKDRRKMTITAILKMMKNSNH
jgi:hypothetical protein